MSKTDELSAALAGLLDRYTALVNSGDAGNWDPETEPPVIAARAALVQQPAADIDEAQIARLHERGAVAWAGVDAADLRAGGDGLRAASGEPNDAQVALLDPWMRPAAARELLRMVLAAAPQPAPARVPPEDWGVFNDSACVADGLTYAEALDYLTPERLQRGWSAVCVANRDNIVAAAPDAQKGEP